MTILVSLADMPPALRYAVQFCPQCAKHAGLFYLVCKQHQAELRAR